MTNTLKSLTPVLIILGLALYGYQHTRQIPSALIPYWIYLSALFAVLIAMLAVHFNRSSLLFSTLLIILVHGLFHFNLISTPLHYALLSGLVPVLILLFTVMPERSLLSVRSLPVYLLILLTAAFTLWSINEKPDWVLTYLLTDWLPIHYFDWTRLPQTSLFIALIVFISLLILNFVKPSPLVAVSLGVLTALLIVFQLTNDSYRLPVFISAALLMCLYAVIQESWRMAYLDELTELPGRRALREKFQSISGVYSVAMLDVDHFKKFNDTYGHDTGDAVLRMIAAKMKKIKGGGLAYRYGGEEFSIVFPGKKAADTEEYLEKLRQTIADMPFVVNRQGRRNNHQKNKRNKSKTVQVTVSIGIADSIDKKGTAWAILKLADTALYRAKKKGRNQLSS